MGTNIERRQAGESRSQASISGQISADVLVLAGGTRRPQPEHESQTNQARLCHSGTYFILTKNIG